QVAKVASNRSRVADPPQPVIRDESPGQMPDQSIAREPLQPLFPPSRVEPRRSGDGQPMPTRLAKRTPDQRRQAALLHGGSDATEAAVELGLRWLSLNQESDGRWSTVKNGGGADRRDLGHDRPGCGKHADTGITGLALLSFLGAGHSHLDGEYRSTVLRGLEFLLRSQDAEGCLGGDAQLYDRMYCHGIALLAVAEALAYTGDQRLKPVVERAVNYTIQAQSTLDGGWRYRPGDSGDMSQFGWQVMALSSAELGGISIPDRTRAGMHRFMSKSTRGQFGGLGCYRPGEGHTPSMTAEALVCRFLLERAPHPPLIEEATDYLQRFLPSINDINFYYWYYGTLALRMSGGEVWRAWNERMVTALLARQTIVGPASGSWPADGIWSGYGGQVFSTALAVLCLESYYRYNISD
ncbi:MAG TPA: terpene cyclase/mutase family protein, partial [Pirellulaceae bacterium]|nr:terpene cyclase/mutase family protein [Pirellulaceae bacterium]